MSVPAHAIPFPVEEPLDTTERIRRIRDAVDWDAGVPRRDSARTLKLAVKRLFDVVVSALALLVLAPVFLVIAIAVKATSRGPVFYEWRVLGKRARPFVGYKFRTMVVDADELKKGYLDRNEMSGPVFKMREDPRITPLGRWLRKYSVDELPQLWSVLKGDMSLVGPRPSAPEEFVAFEPWQWHKLAITPGITCLWQVSGRTEISDFATWVALDLEYIRNWSLSLDMRILLRTIPAVLSARGAY